MPSPSISCGIAGWSYEDWKGTVYPPGTKDTLSFVAPYVDMIELNTSFYHPPSARNAASWVRRTAKLPDFFFTAKLHRDFTHTGIVEASGVETFREGIAPLLEADRLRALLAQFRYDFDNRSEHADRLKQISDAFGDLCPLVLELRHGSWQTPEALAFLQSLGVSVANLDYPTAADSFTAEQCLVGNLRYLRLHGRNRKAWFDAKAGRDQTYDYLYSRDELDAIARRAAALAKDSDGLIVVANNHFQGQEMTNTLELKAKLLETLVDVPPLLKKTYPRLGEIEKPRNSEDSSRGRRLRIDTGP